MTMAERTTARADAAEYIKALRDETPGAAERRNRLSIRLSRHTKQGNREYVQAILERVGRIRRARDPKLSRRAGELASEAATIAQQQNALADRLAEIRIEREKIDAVVSAGQHAPDEIAHLSAVSPFACVACAPELRDVGIQPRFASIDQLIPA